MSPERRRLAFALLISLLIHTLLLSLTFGGQGPGLPGFGFPWQDRRIEVPDLRIVLVPAQVTPVEPVVSSVARPSRRASIRRPVAGGPAPTPSVSRPPPPGGTEMVILPASKPAPKAKPMRNAVAGAAPAKAPLRAHRPGRAAPPQTAGPAAKEPSDAPTFVVPAVPSAPTPVVAAAPSASSPVTATLARRDAGDAAQERIDPRVHERALEVVKPDPPEREAQRRSDQQEAARVETTRLEAERQEAARQAAAQLEAAHQEAERVEAARQEAERQEAARVEAARQEAERQEAARQAAAQLEAVRQGAARQEAAQQAATRQEATRQEATRQEATQEAARQEAARVEAVRQEAERQEAARREAARQEAARVEAERQEAERQEAARQAAAQREAARIEAEQEEAARREAARRAMGRQLDEEATRREAASTAARLPSTLAPSSSGARRGRLWGRTDPNAELIRYAEAWARKIQLNMTFDMVREAAKRPHTDPLVTVAIRSDGSVESVTIVSSSGVAEIDEAITRIVQSQTPYRAFPPALASEFDVIEIRRTWYFDVAIRLY